MQMQWIIIISFLPRTTAVVDSVENKSPYRITMSLSGITMVIDKEKNLQNLNFEIPVHESHQINETFIYVNGENRARLSLAAILNQPQRLGKQTLREFVVKLTMLYPKFLKMNTGNGATVMSQIFLKTVITTGFLK